MTVKYRIVREKRLFKKYYIQISRNNRKYENYLSYGERIRFFTEKGARKFILSISDFDDKIVVKDEGKI